MKRELAALDLHYLIQEFQILIGGKIDKIYQKKARYLFQIYVSGQGKQYLKVYIPNFIFLSETKENYDEPGKFAFALRRHLSNTRIRKIEQKEFERIIEIELEAKDKTYRLMIELFNPGNIVLCDNDYKIILAHEYKGFGSRVIRPGITYEYPRQDYNILALDAGTLRTMIEESEKSSVVVTLAVNLGLGGRYAEELCLMADIDKKKQTLDDKEKQRLFKAIKDMISKKIEATRYQDGKKVVDITPFTMLQYRGSETQAYESYSRALDAYLTKRVQKKKKQKIVSKYEKEKKKLESIINQQEARVKGLATSAEENKRKAELLYEHYTKVEEAIKKAKKKEDHPLIKDRKRNEVTIELPDS